MPPAALATASPPAQAPLSPWQRLHARLPQSRLHVVPGGGHNDLQELDSYLDAVRAALAAL